MEEEEVLNRPREQKILPGKGKYMCKGSLPVGGGT